MKKHRGKDLSTNDFTDGYKNKVDRMVEGTRGYSNYEIAVQNGFTGTEEEWLQSIKGDTPQKGVDYFTQEEIEQIKSDILEAISSLNILIVEELPTENIQGRVIYLVLSDSAKEIKKYNAFVYIDSEWRQIGADIDISKLTVNLVENSYKLTLTEAVEAGGTVTVPSQYKVGLDRLDVYLNGEKLIKATDNDNQGHYYEVGTQGNLSNTINITSDWSAKVGDVFEFNIRTNGQGSEVESDTVIVSATEPQRRK